MRSTYGRSLSSILPSPYSGAVRRSQTAESTFSTSDHGMRVRPEPPIPPAGRPRGPPPGPADPAGEPPEEPGALRPPARPDEDRDHLRPLARAALDRELVDVAAAA